MNQLFLPTMFLYCFTLFALGQQSMLPTNNKLQINTLIKELFEGQSFLPTPKSISKFAHYIDGGLKKCTMSYFGVRRYT